MISKAIIALKERVIQNYHSISVKTRKEVFRFIYAFIIAWFVKTILNEIPFFTQLLLIANLDQALQNSLIQLTELFLKTLGYEVYSEGKFIQIINTVGIRYELGCLAFRHITLFFAFIMAYYGRIINKLWYIPLGVAVIIFINAIRGTILCISQVYFPESSIAIHDIISPVLMYLTTLALWLFWVTKYGSYKKV